MATAARRTANYNTLYSTSIERWYNRDKAEDTIFNTNPILMILGAKKEVEPWGADITVRIVDSKNTTVDSYQYYDTLNTAAMKGPQAARFTLANYNAAITISDQEMRENREPSRIADRIQYHVDVAELSMAERLNIDIYKGNNAKSTNLLGLEQLLIPITDLGTLGAHTNRFQYRQATGSYGGITRAAWTSDTAGGTGWEGLAVEFNDTALNEFQHSSTAPYPPDIGLIELNSLYAFASQGAVHPDLMLSDFLPFQDYELAGQEKMQIQQGSNAFGDLNLGFRNLKYKNATWIMDENAKTQNASAALGAETNGSSNVYLLTTKFLRFLVDEGMDFSLGSPRVPVDSHAMTRHLSFAGQVICTNPRYQARIFDYGT